MNDLNSLMLIGGSILAGAILNTKARPKRRCKRLTYG